MSTQFDNQIYYTPASSLHSNDKDNVGFSSSVEYRPLPEDLTNKEFANQPFEDHLSSVKPSEPFPNFSPNPSSNHTSGKDLNTNVTNDTLEYKSNSDFNNLNSNVIGNDLSTHTPNNSSVSGSNKTYGTLDSKLGDINSNIKSNNLSTHSSNNPTTSGSNNTHNTLGSFKKDNNLTDLPEVGYSIHSNMINSNNHNSKIQNDDISGNTSSVTGYTTTVNTENKDHVGNNFDGTGLDHNIHSDLDFIEKHKDTQNTSNIIGGTTTAHDSSLNNKLPSTKESNVHGFNENLEYSSNTIGDDVKLGHGMDIFSDNRVKNHVGDSTLESVNHNDKIHKGDDHSTYHKDKVIGTDLSHDEPNIINNHYDDSNIINPNKDDSLKSKHHGNTNDNLGHIQPKVIDTHYPDASLIDSKDDHLDSKHHKDTTHKSHSSDKHYKEHKSSGVPIATLAGTGMGVSSPNPLLAENDNPTRKHLNEASTTDNDKLPHTHAIGTNPIDAAYTKTAEIDHKKENDPKYFSTKPDDVAKNNPLNQSDHNEHVKFTDKVEHIPADTHNSTKHSINENKVKDDHISTNIHHNTHSANGNHIKDDHTTDSSKPSAISGHFDKIKGKVKQGLGKVLNNEEMKIEGKAKIHEGEAKLEAARAHNM